MPNVVSYSSNELISSDLPIRDMGTIGLLEPNEAPLVTLLMRTPSKVSATNPKFEWKEDDFLGMVTTATALVAANATAVTVADDTIFVVGDIVMVMPSNTSGTAPERFQITAIDRGTKVLTVRRYLGGVATGATIPANTPLMNIGNASEEGGNLPGERRTVPVNKTNYTQIFKTMGSWSRTAMSMKTYGQPGGTYEYDVQKFAVDHKRMLNRSLLFGVPSESLSAGPTGKPVRTSGGLMSAISTNVVDAGGTLTLANFLSYMDTAFRYGSKEKFALCPPIVMNAIANWSINKLLISPGTTEFGMFIQTFISPYGKLHLVLDRTLANTGNFGFGNNMFIVDPTEIGQRPLSGNGYTGSTRMIENALSTGVDGRSDYIITETGWEIKQDKKHMRIFNITGYSTI